MNRQGLLLAMLLATGMMACSSQDDVTEKVDKTDKANGPQHPWKTQVEALDKAKHVEQDMMDAYQRRAQEMEKQEQ